MLRQNETVKEETDSRDKRSNDSDKKYQDEEH